MVAAVAVLLVGDVAAIVLLPEEPSSDGNTGLRSFSSKKELEDFIGEGLKRARAEGLPYNMAVRMAEKAVATQNAPAAASDAADYSSTNVQVEGVDEADIVKTDGKFIYVVSDKRLIIVEAYPAREMKRVSTTVVNGSILGLFVQKDRLVIFEGSWYSGPIAEPMVSRSMIAPQRLGGFHIKVFDISNRTSPRQVRDLSLNGSYVNSRMIGDWVYAVARQPAFYWVRDTPSVVLPSIGVEGKVKAVPATSVYYPSNSTDVPVDYSIIVALNVQAGSGEPELRVVLTGVATNMYVSKKNIYMVVPKGGWWRSEGATIIHRIAVDGQRIELKASGEVPGWVLNQFSMDEYNDHFRIATTTGRVSRGTASQVNNVYVLDGDMKVVGRLEELAPSERIYSARFMGDRAYLVTFKKIDPLFTIDLSKPSEPKVLGQLKIPGYSDYLHPFGDKYLLGIGKETVEAKEGDFAWYQGLKVSLFDVSDVAKPKEVGKLIIGDRGTDSPVLRDHHAMLLDKSKSLLVIPVLEAKIFPEKYPSGVHPSMQGEYVFQGAYVLKISPEEGISVNGKISHVDDPQSLLKSGYYFQSNQQIERSLYIGEALYTLSGSKIKANSMANMTEISTIRLS